MKAKLLFAGALALIFLACGQKPQSEGYTITGEIAGVTGKVYLTLFEGKMPQRIDSTEVVNGTFSFTGKQPLPMLASIDTPEHGAILRFFLENSPITITGSADAPDRISVLGSTSEEMARKYRADIDSISEVFYSDSAAVSTPAGRDSLEKLINARRMEFVKANPGSVVAAYVLYRELSYYMPYDELYQAVAAFDEPVKQSVYLKLVASMADAQKKTSIGQHYTDVSAPDRDGKELALSSVVGPGKYVLLDFWASWCPPCRAESPYMVAAYKEFAPKGFEIYAVSLDKTKEAWQKGIADLNLGWKHVSELKFWDSKAAEMYGVRSIPANILIGPDGTGKTSKGSVSVAPNHAVIWSTVSQRRVFVPGMEGVIWSGESGTIGDNRMRRGKT